MSFIKSRQHAAKPISSAASSQLAGLALLSLTLPIGAWAQATAAEPADKALPVVRTKATATVANEFKAESASSPKFVKPLLDTPQTISVINKELIQQQGTASLSEALRNTPGITFTLGENGFTNTGDTVFMRGFDASGAIFVDGVRDLGGITRDTFNLESVEVVKGPSGADTGRGNPTGYINLVSKKAQLRDFAEGSAQVASGNRVRLTADLNKKLDIGLPGAALRLNVFSDRGDALQRDVITRNSWGVAPSLTLGLGTATRATLSYLHVQREATPDGGIAGVGLMGWDNLIVYKDLAAATAKVPQGTLVRGVTPVDRSQFYGATADSDSVKADMLTVLLEHDLAPATTLSNTTRFGVNEQLMLLTNTIIRPDGAWGVIGDPAKPATWTVGRNRVGRDQRNQILANQTNLSSAFELGGLRNNVSTGLELTHEQQNTAGFTSDSKLQDRANLYSPKVADKFAPIVSNGSTTVGSTVTAAAYLFDTLDISPSFQLSAGLRGERYRTEFTTMPATVGFPLASPPALATTGAKAGSLFSGKLGGLYKPTQNGSVYLSYSTSQKPPGSDSFSFAVGSADPKTGTINGNAARLDPQEASNVELGTKWDLFEKQLLLTAALFKSENKNELARADSATGEVTQYGKKTVKGLELGAAGAITADLQLQTGLLWMDSKVNQASVVAPGEIDSQTGAGLVYSPRLTFTSWLSYKVPHLAGLSLGGGARYTSTQATQVNNGLTPVVGINGMPAYWVFDAMAAYEINKQIGLQFNVSNLADKFYIAAVNNGRNRFTLGAPRSLSLSLNLKY